MIEALKALARLVTFLLLVILAVAGLAAAVLSIAPSVAEVIRLPELRDAVGELLRVAEAPGVIPLVTALAALGAIVLGLLLLIGALAPEPERLVLLEEGAEGTLAARKRPLGQIAGALTEQTRGVTAAKAKLRPSRRGTGGRIEVEAAHPRTADPGEVRQRATEALASLAGAFKLKTRVRPKLGERGSRVQ